MKKFLFLVFSVAGLLSGNAAFSQNPTYFTTVRDTLSFTVPTTGNTITSVNEIFFNNIINLGTDSLQISWHVLNSNFPADWLGSIGACDNKNCFSNSYLTNPALKEWTNGWHGGCRVKLGMMDRFELTPTL